MEVVGRGSGGFLAQAGQKGLQQSQPRDSGCGVQEGGRLTCRLVSCCCWCAMVCFTSTLLMLCSIAYFLACKKRQ